MRLHFQMLKRFHKQNKTQRVCAAVLAKQMDESVLHELHTTFDSIDEDEDGIITLEEFTKACSKLGLDSSDQDQLGTMFADMDMNGDGVVDYTEFIAACFDRKIKQQEEVCWAAFRVFDLDSSGSITFEELQKVLSSATMQATFSKTALKQLWLQFSGESPSREGAIDFDHFLAAIRGIKPAPGAARSSLGEAPAKKTRVEEDAPGDQSSSSRDADRASMGASLPMAARSSGRASLPMASKTASLPVASRAAGLPVAARSAEIPSTGEAGDTAHLLMSSTKRASLPLPSKSASLPMASRTASLPIAPRRSSADDG